MTKVRQDCLTFFFGVKFSCSSDTFFAGNCHFDWFWLRIKYESSSFESNQQFVHSVRAAQELRLHGCAMRYNELREKFAAECAKRKKCLTRMSIRLSFKHSQRCAYLCPLYIFDPNL